jgi:poly(A) polymerase
MKPDSAIEIVRTLRGKGHEAYLVGGCVRDMVMHLEPTDYDIATSALPEVIMQIFPHTEAIGVQFGVVLVIHKGHPFEVATFRSDEAYVDGRRPTGVVFTDARTDVLRRDFTINGLLYDPIEDRVLDYVSGQEDIRNRVVRAIGNPEQRFTEDKLRLLRAVRFAARFDYTVDPPTWEAVCKLAPGIGQVSAERISMELQRILTEGHADRGCRLLAESGLFQEILPEVQWTDHLNRTLALVAGGAAPDFALAVLLHHVQEAEVQRIASRLRLSRAETQHAVSLVVCQSRFHALKDIPVSARKRFLRSPRFEDHLELARLCAAASDREPDDFNFAAGLSRAWSQNDLWPPPLVSGDDLIAMGFAPGPRFKEILTRVEDEQLEGRLSTRRQAVDFVNSHYAART